MTTRFEERLNQILPRLISPDVLSNQGAGGEIGFWIFDYPPEEEMAMRAWLADVIEPGLRKQVPAVRFQTVDLFQLVVDLLDERKLFDKACEMQANKGDAAVLASLRSVLKEDRLAARMTEKRCAHRPSRGDRARLANIRPAQPASGWPRRCASPRRHTCPDSPISPKAASSVPRPPNNNPSPSPASPGMVR